MKEQQFDIEITINGEQVRGRVSGRMLLGDFLREHVGLNGTHHGCEHGVCGACTIMLDGVSARSCLLFAVQADGADIRTVESLAASDALHPLQVAFKKHHALQCGYCTPGMLMTCVDLLENHKLTSEADIREGISGNICRCTGYQNIVAAVKEVAGLEEN
ncbi:MAG: (2Fe-2S)-binding protein [Pseudomonadota bacterium]